MTTHSFICYDLITGEILSQKGVPYEDEILPNVPEGCGHVLGEWDYQSYYVDMGIPVLKPNVPVMVGATYDLSLLPAGSSLVITDPVGVDTIVDAQVDTLELTDPGTWYVRTDQLPFPWLGFETTIVIEPVE